MPHRLVDRQRQMQGIQDQVLLADRGLLGEAVLHRLLGDAGRLGKHGFGRDVLVPRRPRGRLEASALAVAVGHRGRGVATGRGGDVDVDQGPLGAGEELLLPFETHPADGVPDRRVGEHRLVDPDQKVGFLLDRDRKGIDRHRRLEGGLVHLFRDEGHRPLGAGGGRSPRHGDRLPRCALRVGRGQPGGPGKPPASAGDHPHAEADLLLVARRGDAAVLGLQALAPEPDDPHVRVGRPLRTRDVKARKQLFHAVYCSRLVTPGHPAVGPTARRVSLGRGLFRRRGGCSRCPRPRRRA